MISTPQEIAEIERSGEVVLIAHKLIRPFANQPRTYFDQNALKELAESIKENGQLVPIFVKELKLREDGYRFELIEGQRRWYACEMAQKKQMKAIVLSPQNEQEQFTISVICNFGRVGHTHEETALAIKRFLDFGKDVEEISKIFARSTPWVYQHLKILKLHPDVLRMLSPELPEDEQLLFSTALLVADLPPNLQKKTAKMIIKNKLKYVQAKNVIRTTAEGLGISVGGERTPKHDFNILRSLLEKFNRESEVLLSHPQGFFDKMFEFRDQDDHKETCEKAKRSLNNIEILVKTLDRVPKKEKV